MTNVHKQLKQAAAALEAAADQLEKTEAQLKTATAAPVAKTAADKSAAEAVKVKLAAAAKEAAARVKKAGLLSSQEQADAFAAQILDHSTALAKIAALTDHVSAPKLGHVIANTERPQTADEAWESRARRALSTTR